MVEFSKNKWKYSTIGLLAILAVGFSFPQASAHITTNVQHGMTHVIELLTAIKANTDNLPEDPASDSSLPTQVITEVSFGMINCTSDDDFIVHIFSNTRPGGNFDLEVLDAEGFNEGQIILPNTGTEPTQRSMTTGGEPGFTVKVGNSASDETLGFTFVTLETTEGAEASCEQED